MSSGLRRLKEGGTPLWFVIVLLAKAKYQNVSGAKHLAFIPPPMLIVSERIEMSIKTENSALGFILAIIGVILYKLQDIILLKCYYNDYNNSYKSKGGIMHITVKVTGKELDFLIEMQKLLNSDKATAEKPSTLAEVVLECIRTAMYIGAKDKRSQQA